MSDYGTKRTIQLHPPLSAIGVTVDKANRCPRPNTIFDAFGV
jgi:hypothetical protein